MDLKCPGVEKRTVVYPNPQKIAERGVREVEASGEASGFEGEETRGFSDLCSSKSCTSIIKRVLPSVIPLSLYKVNHSQPCVVIKVLLRNLKSLMLY